MRKIILFMLIILTTASCATTKINKVRIKDYNEKMELIEMHFPQIYLLYIQGKVAIDNVYTYTEKKTGEEKVNLSYHYLN